ncbi:MAG: hypothetical protein LLG08_03150 [Actinomycetia bacterium]|nr:hypothetical protein [Actinomycetes bacterium]
MNIEQVSRFLFGLYGRDPAKWPMKLTPLFDRLVCMEPSPKDTRDDTIRTLRLANGRLREALEPFARHADVCALRKFPHDMGLSFISYEDSRSEICVADVYRARDALLGEKEKKV